MMILQFNISFHLISMILCHSLFHQDKSRVHTIMILGPGVVWSANNDHDNASDVDDDANNVDDND